MTRPHLSVELRLEIQDFIALELALLDEWRLEEWLELFTLDGKYSVPTTPTNRDANVRSIVSFIDDDIELLRARIVRLNSRRAHREFPWSRTRHVTGFLRVDADGTDGYVCSAPFFVSRIREGHIDLFIGNYLYVLRVVDGTLRIASKRIDLDHESLDSQGTISIIL